MMYAYTKVIGQSIKEEKAMRDNLYSDIALRTQGDIYIGVVGPVRTGKSTFIKRFMDLLVLPNIQNDYKRERAMDELPQSAAGKMIMTTEPKFIPNEAAQITIGNHANLKVRMIDCVGYVVPGALGHIEDEMPRMVMTPWSANPMQFEQAAEIGTRKVISEHSTVGVVVTTDGSITEIPREDYIEAEERVINELLALNKPFVILLNSANPESKQTKKLAETLADRYNATVIPTNCSELTVDDINDIMEKILYEFPLKELSVSVPAWLTDSEGESIADKIYKAMDSADKISDVKKLPERLRDDCEFVDKADITVISPGYGEARIEVSVPDSLFYKTLNERSGLNINDRQGLLSEFETMSRMKKEYDKVAAALREVDAKGYGIVYPSIDELTLEEPEIIKQGSRFGVRLKAGATSIHMIKANIQTEVSPLVGTERQSEELIEYLMSEFESDPKQIWQSNIFGKSLHELVNEGLHNKLAKMPEDARDKLRETLERIINEGSGGLICIIL